MNEFVIESSVKVAFVRVFVNKTSINTIHLSIETDVMPTRENQCRGCSVQKASKGFNRI